MSAALELRDVRAGYGRIEILRGISLTVPSGSVVALLGPNGVGKTTTLRAISGTLPVTAGSITLAGRRIDNRRPSAIARQGVVLVPEGRGIFPALTVEDNLRVAHRSAQGVPWHQWCDEIASVFPRLAERRSQLAGSLSGGEQQMLAVCRSMVGDPRVVMFDELSMGLAALRDAGRTIVLVEQHLTYALELADLCYVLAKGQVAWAGEPAELRRSGATAALLPT